MNEKISHRGPDDQGQKFFPYAALGHRRLSIIDIAGGHQPMPDFRKKTWIAFNGEIYNFKDLRKKIEGKGISFRTHSDTEVLVNLLADQGKEALPNINGMFGFAYYNPDKDYGLVARDHLGIKPVYYTENDEWIAFASEIKALLILPWLNFQVEESLLEEIFTFRFVTGKNTLFKGVFQVEAGEYIELINGHARKGKFWDLPIEHMDYSSTLDQSVEELDSLLTKSIEGQMIADVPLGAFLSGGVDSGVVTAMASRKKKDMERLKTFIVGFEDKAWDERPHAMETAKRYNTDHFEYIMKGEKILSDLKNLTYYQDEPITHPNTIPIYHLCKLAKKEVKVVLTGEGADEMLSGYPRHQILRVRNLMSNILLHPIQKSLGTFFSKLPYRKAAMLGEGLRFLTDEEALIFNSQFVRNELVNKIILPEVKREGLTHRRFYANHSKEKNLHKKLMTLDVKTYLLSALQRLDRMSMANGLECRVPFLDYHLVEWAMNIPPEFKVQGTKGKYVLKRLAQKYMNSDIIYMPKSGFGMPLADWFRDPKVLKPFLDEVSVGNFYLKEYFDNRVVKQLIKQHLDLSKDNSEFFWILLCVHTWYEVFRSS